jgi:frizzled protein 1/7
MRTFVAIVLASLAPRLKCDTCQGFSVPFCATAGYNMTKLPNRFGHSESQIQTKLKMLKPLGMTDCHKDLRQFVCLFYMPFCGYGRNPLLPCRQQCEQIQSQCRKQIEYFKFGWLLNEINCQDLPSYSSDEMKCAGYAGEGGTSLSESLAPADTSQIQCTQPEKMECPAELEMLAGDSPSKYNFLGLANCGPPCTDHFWTEAEIKLSRKWILGWGVLCLISTLFTVCTYLIDRERFRYPERPIVFLAACYLIVSVVYITGFFMDFDVSCTRNNKDLENPFFSQNPTLVVIQGTKNQACTVLFMILYFSTMASSIWWLVLCVNWFLAAVLKWSGEAIENQSQYFHLVAWAVPAITTVSVLALGRIEGDPLSGICSVGQYDTQSLQIFLLWPQLGLLFHMFKNLN